MRELKEADVTALRAVLSSGEPLGPSFADRLIDHPEASALLFAAESKVYSRSTRPGFVVGRRGSGKTAFLNHLRQTSAHTHQLVIDPADTFPQIIRTIRNLFRSPPPTVELIEELWDVLIWTCVFIEMVKHGHDGDARTRSLEDFAALLGAKIDNTPDQTIFSALEWLRESMDNGALVETPRELRRAFSSEGISYDDARTSASELLEISQAAKSNPVLVLMDTLEKYDVSQGEAVHAISGLIRFVGQRATSKHGLDIRFCLPVELYNTFQEASHNPSKDFSSATSLQWHAGDLLAICAHRLMLYLRMVDCSRHRELRQINTEHRAGAVALFQSLLPDAITNTHGISEPTLAYVLRHTQLLPRHALHILNNILSAAIDHSTGILGEINDRHVISGIKNAELSIVNGIMQAYEHRYPHLRTYCEDVLPQLSRRFSDGMLHRAFNQHGQKVKKRLKSGDDELDYPHFKKMLMEVGAIGRFQAETDVYYEAEYAYTVPADLVVSLEDDLCLHPIFSSVYRGGGNGSDSKPVYPYGSDPNRD